MTGFFFSAAAVPAAVAHWQDQEDIMADTATKLRGADISGLPPALRATATRFRNTWGGFATSASTAAGTKAGQIEAAGARYIDTDYEVQTSYREKGTVVR